MIDIRFLFGYYKNIDRSVVKNFLFTTIDNKATVKDFLTVQNGGL
jgi:hypothetical protein